MNMMDLKFIKDKFSKFKLLVIIFFLINLIFFLNLIFFNKFEYFYIPSIKKIEFNGQVNSFYIKSIKNILITFDRISFSKFHSIEILNYNKIINVPFAESSVSSLNYLGIEQNSTNVPNLFNLSYTDISGNKLSSIYEKPKGLYIHQNGYELKSKFDRKYIDRFLNKFYGTHIDSSFYFGKSVSYFVERSFDLKIPSNFAAIKIVLNDDSQNVSNIDTINLRLSDYKNNFNIIKIDKILKVNDSYYGFIDLKNFSSNFFEKYSKLNHLYLHSSKEELIKENKIKSIELLYLNDRNNHFYLPIKISFDKYLYLLPIENGNYFNSINLITHTSNDSKVPIKYLNNIYAFFSFESTSDLIVGIKDSTNSSNDIGIDDDLKLKTSNFYLLNTLNIERMGLGSKVLSSNRYYQLLCFSDNFDSNLFIVDHKTILSVIKRCSSESIILKSYAPIFNSFSESIIFYQDLFKGKVSKFKIFDYNDKNNIPIFITEKNQIIFGETSTFKSTEYLNELILNDNNVSLLLSSKKLSLINPSIDKRFINLHFKSLYFNHFISFVFINCIFLIYFFQFGNFINNFFVGFYKDNIITLTFNLFLSIITITYIFNFYSFSSNFSVILYLFSIIFILLATTLRWKFFYPSK
jgi:hypothetical protein